MKFASSYNFFKKLCYIHAFHKDLFLLPKCMVISGTISTANWCMRYESMEPGKMQKEVHKFHHLRVNWAWFVL